MPAAGRFEIAGTREHHVSNVVPLHRPRVNPNHPSITTSTVVFDQEDPAVHAADRCVLLTQIEAQLIATLLDMARPHLPSPLACDQAIELLTGKVPNRA
jgi:hypothetical protein